MSSRAARRESQIACGQRRISEPCSVGCQGDVPRSVGSSPHPRPSSRRYHERSATLRPTANRLTAAWRAVQPLTSRSRITLSRAACRVRCYFGEILGQRSDRRRARPRAQSPLSRTVTSAAIPGDLGVDSKAPPTPEPLPPRPPQLQLSARGRVGGRETSRTLATRQSSLRSWRRVRAAIALGPDTASPQREGLLQEVDTLADHSVAPGSDPAPLSNKTPVGVGAGVARAWCNSIRAADPDLRPSLSVLASVSAGRAPPHTHRRSLPR